MENWHEIYDENSGKYYYYHKLTQETTWNKPVMHEVMNTSLTKENVNGIGYDDLGIKEPWKALFDESTQKYYYYNTITNETTWIKPEINDDIKNTNDWQEIINEDGTVYYCNLITNQSSWENPLLKNEINNNNNIFSDNLIIDEWKELYDEGTKQIYYANLKTGQTQWEKPLTSYFTHEESIYHKESIIETTDIINLSNEFSNIDDTVNNKNINMSLYNSNDLNLPTNYTPQGYFKQGDSNNKTSSPSKLYHSTAPDDFLALFLDNHIIDIDSNMNNNSFDSVNNRNDSIEIEQLNNALNESNSNIIINSLEGNNNEETALYISILDNISSSTLATKASDIILSISSEIYKSNILLSYVSKKMSIFKLEKYAEVYFHYDRRSISSTTNISQNIHPCDKLLSYQSEQLKSSLTVLPMTSLMSDAIYCFKLILSFMNTNTTTTTNNTINTINTEVNTNNENNNSINSYSSLQKIDIALSLLYKLVSSPVEIHDEVYCQLCKQTRKNYNIDSLEIAWQLFVIVIATIPPSRHILPYLINHISTSLNRIQSNNQFEHVKKFVFYALKEIIPATSAPFRKVIPSKDEIRALLLNEMIDINIYTLEKVDTLKYNSYILPISSYTTIEMLLKMICTELEIKEENQIIFAIYECIITNDDNDVDGGDDLNTNMLLNDQLLDPSSRVLDWFSKRKSEILFSNDHELINNIDITNSNSNRLITTDKLTHCLVLKARYLFRLYDHIHDNSTMNLLYAQSIYDVLSAKYLYSIADALMLAAFMLQDLCGDYISGTRSINDLKVKGKSLTLSKFISKLILNEQNTISIIDNNKMDEIQFISNNMKYKILDLEQKVLNLYKGLHGLCKEEVRIAYFSFINSWKVYGASFYMVSGQVNNTFTNIILSISINSILLIDPITQCYIVEYQYKDIFSWGHSFDAFILILGTKTTQIKSHFKTSQGKEIDSLIYIYYQRNCMKSTLITPSNIHMQSSSDYSKSNNI